jgi:RNA polymerase sigma-70 factor (ECF subfamily)
MAFPTTRWSVVLGATREQQGPPRALHELCEVYWRPLYVYLRRDGLSAEDAEDTVQGFLSSLLSRAAQGGIVAVDRERGRFRSYLLGALRNYLSNERVKQRAQKRGGGAATAPLTLGLDDLSRAEAQLQVPDHRTPEAAYAHGWAMAILEQTQGRLEQLHADKGKAEAFAALRPFLLSGDAPSYRDVAARLGLTEAAARVAVHRLRAEFRALLRQQVAETVSSEAEVDDELRAVIAAIADPAGP